MNPMMIREHSESLDKFIQLIPTRLYLPDDEEDTNKKWLQGLSKVAKDIANRENN